MGRVKVIKTRHITEVYQYENCPSHAGGRTKKESKEWRSYRAKNGKRQRDHLRRLITANFGSGDRFVTLTFANGAVSDVKDVEACFEALRAFRERVRRRYPDVKAIIVVEFQDKNGRGAVHYHMICNLPYIPSEELAKLWGNGFIRINRIDHVDNVGAYVVKYMSKDVDDVRLRKRKSYYRIGKLEEPEVIMADDLAQVDIPDGDPAFSNVYGTEYHGRIRYDQYNVSRKQDKE